MEKVDILNSFLSANKIQAECINTIRKGCVNLFELKTENNFRLSKLTSLSQELMLTMRGFSIPSIKIDVDKCLLQIEMMSERVPTANLLEDLTLLVDNEKLPMILGNSVYGDKVSFDTSRNPHLLIGGTTGSGKSSLLHTIIANILYRTNADINIVDTKGVEFGSYAEFSSRVKLTDNYKDYKILLEYLNFVMEKRYNFIKKHPDIDVFNNNYFKPSILIIDEFADLSMQDTDNDGYDLLCRLVQKCRACGIFCVLATQRPSADVITGVIKANFPARIACKVASKTDSRIILDHNGAEVLTTIGSAIIHNYKYNLEKFQVSFASPRDIIKFLNEKMASNT